MEEDYIFEDPEEENNLDFDMGYVFEDPIDEPAPLSPITSPTEAPVMQEAPEGELDFAQMEEDFQKGGFSDGEYFYEDPTPQKKQEPAKVGAPFPAFALKPEMIGDVPVGTEVRLGFEGGHEGGGYFDRAKVLWEKYGVTPNEEAWVIEQHNMWASSPYRESITREDILKAYEERGINPPREDEIERTLPLIHQGYRFTALDTTAEETSFELAKQAAREKRNADTSTERKIGNQVELAANAFTLDLGARVSAMIEAVTTDKDYQTAFAEQLGRLEAARDDFTVSIPYLRDLPLIGPAFERVAPAELFGGALSFGATAKGLEGLIKGGLVAGSVQGAAASEAQTLAGFVTDTARGATLGTMLGGTVDGSIALISQLRYRNSAKNIGVDGGELTPIVANDTKMTPEAEARFALALERGSADDILMSLEDTPFTLPRQVAEDFVAARGKAERDAFTARMAEEQPLDPRVANDNAPEAVLTPELQRPEPVLARAPAVAAKVDEVVGNWTNRPDIVTVERFDELPDDVREGMIRDGAEDAPSLIAPDGKIYIVADKIDFVEDIPPMLFHEGLAHYGLSQRFREGLDEMLEKFYSSNENIRMLADDYLERYKGAYSESGNQKARAVEEALAEMSEDGIVEPSLFRRLHAMVKQFLRKMNWDVDYTDAEIRTILGMAHQKVIKGAREDMPQTSDNRYMYAGRRAETADMIPEEEWFVGPDGKERFEFADFSWMFDQSLWNSLEFREWATLKELLPDHDMLFASYPFLEDVKVHKSYDTHPGSLGWVDTQTGAIHLTQNVDKPSFSTMGGRAPEVLFHEIQHMIQMQEGFAMGGNRETAVTRMDPEHLGITTNNFRKYTAETIRRDEVKLAAMENILAMPETQAVTAIYDKFAEADALPDYDARQAAWEGLYEELDSALYDLKLALGVDPEFVPSGDPSWNVDAKKLRDHNEFLDVVEYLVNGTEGAAKQLDDDFYALGQRKVDLAELDAVVDQLVNPAPGSGVLRTQRLIDRLKKLLLRDEQLSFQAYESLFGEVEARDTARRIDLTESARSLRKPYAADPVKPSEYVFDMPGDGVNRYMRSRRREAGGINVDRIESTKDIERVFKMNAAKANLAAGMSHEAIRDIANARKMSVDELMELEPNLDPVRITQARDLLVKYAEYVDYLENRIAKGDNSDNMMLEYAKALTTEQAVYEKVRGITANASRTLNAMKINAKAFGRRGGDFRYSLEKLDLGNIKTMDDLRKLAALRQSLRNDPKARAKLDKSLFDPTLRDYATTLWYVGLLADPATQGMNIAGQLGTLGIKVMDTLVAAVLTAPGRAFGKEAVPFREVAANLQGLYGALKLWKTYQKPTGETMRKVNGTWSKTIDAFAKGAPLEGEGRANTRGAIYPWWTGVEVPLRMMAATDEFFFNVMYSMNIDAALTRKGFNEGYRGADLTDYINSRRSNPTQEMFKEVMDETLMMQFRDNPSVAGSKINSLVQFGPNDTKTATAGKMFLRTLVPFVNTMDGIFRYAVRYTPMGKLDRYNAADWNAGGAKRMQALGRMALGTAFGAYVASQVLGGSVSGAGPQDPGVRKVLESQGWQPYSIKTKDGWVSYQGLDPVANYVKIIATTIEQTLEAGEKFKEYKEEQKRDALFKSMGDQMSSATRALLKSTAASGWTDGLFNFIETLDESAQGQSGWDNFLANQATALVPGQALLRGVTRRTGEGVRRDTSGDTSLFDRAAGRIQAITPLTEGNLPVAHDVYGREIQQPESIISNWLLRLYLKPEETDPAVLEVMRLEKKMAEGLDDIEGKFVVGAADRGDLADIIEKKEGRPRPVFAEELQTYIKESGSLIRDGIAEQIASPGWKEISDADKVRLLKKMVKDYRKYVRESMYPDPEEEEVEYVFE